MFGEAGEHLPVPRPSTFKASEDRHLIWLVGDSKARLESYLSPKFAEQRRTEGVNRPALHLLAIGA